MLLVSGFERIARSMFGELYFAAFGLDEVLSNSFAISEDFW
jgi:hypothetical protein